MKARSRSIHLSVHIHKDPAAMAERAAHILAAACEEAVAERGVFRIALSGGQTPIPCSVCWRPVTGPTACPGTR